MARKVTRERGALEAEVVQTLRRFDGAVGVREIQDQFSAPQPAYTTLLTVLDRLTAKGLVTREELSPRKVRFAATHTGEEHASSIMMSALSEADDKRAALLRFAGNLDDEDIAFLRDALTRGR